jgi:hypothetical protein
MTHNLEGYCSYPSELKMFYKGLIIVNLFTNKIFLTQKKN